MRTSLALTVHLQIHDGKREEIEKLGAECVAIVQEQELGKGTIRYAWAIRDDGREFVLHEEYESSEAFLTHLRNVGPIIQQIAERSDISVAIFGRPSPEVRAAMGPFHPAIYAPLLDA